MSKSNNSKSKAKTTHSVKVRMYCQGLGDCFLLTFPAKGNKTFHLLIDCGVLLGTPDDKELMGKVADDILTTTKKKLDLALITHEHWDHLSGFIDAQSEFKDLHIDRLWLAWTEDPADKLAQKLRKKREEAKKNLYLALDKLAGEDQRLLGVAEFFGAKEARKRSTENALKWVCEQVAGDQTTYHSPGGSPKEFPDVENVRVYILGPPRDETMLKRDRPRKGEVYHLAFDDEEDDFFAEALADGPASDRPGPFDLRRVRAKMPEHARGNPFFRTHYFGAGEAGPEAWRQIEHDWLGEAEHLALKLDSDTNNTSLAIAIELLPSKRVLLFPGDAQVGNWQSWHDQTWSVHDRDGDHQVTAEDLLNRTVLYKVGHHGSHNATLKGRGLEMMNSPDLIAMLPVDQQVAFKRNWKRMPLQALVEELTERTDGRVLRPDKPIPKKMKNRVETGKNKNYMEVEIPME